ncbi:MAG: Spy/CpxP family protein refolding chaperone [Cyanobacteria bacterium P01_G01_bin.49]
MIGKETALIVTILTLTIGGTVALAESVKETSSSVMISSETEIVAQRGAERDEREEKGPEKFVEQLNLSDQQVQQLSTIRQKYRPQIEQLAEKARATGEELGQMMQGNASDSDLRIKHQEMTNLRQQMGDLRFESMLEMREVLTNEQRQEFVQLMQQRRQRSSWHRGNEDSTP